MAKKSSSPAPKKVAKSPTKPTSPKPKAPAALAIEKACADSLKKLKAMKAELGLQADIEWCLGSYRHDKNPSGLYVMAERALLVFKGALVKNSKAVPAKLISDIEKALKSKVL